MSESDFLELWSNSNPKRLDFRRATSLTVSSESMLNITWKVERCPKCRHVAVKSEDGSFGCLECRKLPKPKASGSLHGCCVFCGQPLIMLMEACLTCGNQPKD